MKNTKISLINGLMLTITLFTTIQISTMAPEINPYLNDYQRGLLESYMKEDRKFIENELKLEREKEGYKPFWIPKMKKHLKDVESLYFGNRPVTRQDLNLLQR